MVRRIAKVVRTLTIAVEVDATPNAERAFSRSLTAQVAKWGASIVEDSGWTSPSKASEDVKPIAKQATKQAPKAESTLDEVIAAAIAKALGKVSEPEDEKGDFFTDVIVAKAKAKTHKCTKRGCHGFGRSYSDLGWDGDATHAGHKVHHS
jgi:hypothetical protein